MADRSMSNEEIIQRAIKMFHGFNTAMVEPLVDVDLDKYKNTVTGNHVAARIAALAISRFTLLDGDSDPAGLISVAANQLLALLRGETLAAGRA